MVPVASPVVLYAVVAAPIEAEARKIAALNVSFVVAPRVTVVPKAWMPFSSSTLKLVAIPWVLLMTHLLCRIRSEGQKSFRDARAEHDKSRAWKRL